MSQANTARKGGQDFKIPESFHQALKLVLMRDLLQT